MKKSAIGGVVLVVAVVGLTIVGRSLKTAGIVASERPNTDLADLSANRVISAPIRCTFHECVSEYRRLVLS